MQTNTVSTFSRNRKAVILPTAMASLWSRTSLLNEFWDVVQAVGAWPGATIFENRGGFALTLDGVELGQLAWGGQLVLKFGPHARNAIVAENMARVAPHQHDASRVVFDIRSRIDVSRALSLLRLAYLVGNSGGDLCLDARAFSHTQYANLA